MIGDIPGTNPRLTVFVAFPDWNYSALATFSCSAALLVTMRFLKKRGRLSGVLSALWTSLFKGPFERVVQTGLRVLWTRWRARSLEASRLFTTLEPVVAHIWEKSTGNLSRLFFLRDMRARNETHIAERSQGGSGSTRPSSSASWRWRPRGGAAFFLEREKERTLCARARVFVWKI